MNRLIAFALASALLTSAASAQTVSDDVSKQLWCGTAMAVAFSTPPEGITDAQLAEAKVYVDGGNALIDTAVQAHLDAGFTQEAVDKLKTDLVAEVTPIVTNAEGAGPGKYSFEECVAILPGAPTAPTADTTSSAQ